MMQQTGSVTSDIQECVNMGYQTTADPLASLATSYPEGRYVDRTIPSHIEADAVAVFR
jgi:hypothetical protein